MSKPLILAILLAGLPVAAHSEDPQPARAQGRATPSAARLAAQWGTPSAQLSARQ